ncbi:hypothetical protein PV325_011813, partial [Microctonus aethiopoides]
QTSDLDTLLCRQDLEQLQKLDDDDPDKNSRETIPIDDFFETTGPAACRPQASFVSSRSQPAGNDDDVFLRPPLWEDITSSIQKLDPENADMLGSQSHPSLSTTSSHIKMENDDVTSSPVLSPVEIKSEPLTSAPPTLHLLEGRQSNMVNFVRSNDHTQHRTALKTFHNNNNNNNNSTNNNNNNTNSNNNNNNSNSSNNSNEVQANHHSNSGTSPLYGSMTRLMYVSPLTPPISDPGSPLGGPPRRTPPPPYPQPSSMLNPSHRIQQSTITKFNRRNNPELEKRRVHHCDFIGCTKVYTKSSHLKAHQRIHTGEINWN